MPDVKMVNVTIDGRVVTVPDGTLIVGGVGARQRWQAVIDLVLACHARNGGGWDRPAKAPPAAGGEGAASAVSQSE